MYRNVFLVFCPITLFCVQKSFSSRPGNAILRDQPPPGFLCLFPMLARGRTKLEAERSGLNDVIEEIVREGGCHKRKAELLKTNGPKLNGGEIGKVRGAMR